MALRESRVLYFFGYWRRMCVHGDRAIVRITGRLWEFTKKRGYWESLSGFKDKSPSNYLRGTSHRPDISYDIMAYVSRQRLKEYIPRKNNVSHHVISGDVEKWGEDK